MNTRVLYLFTSIVFVASVTVNIENDDPNLIISEDKIELSPFLISSSLNDIIIISAPIINNSTKYYLNRPNGQVTRLNLESSINCKNITDDYYDIQIKYFKSLKVISPVNRYRVFNPNEGSKFFPTDVFREYEEKMGGNDFMIGPLEMNDHGNWVLSAYYQRRDAKWVEVFQVITVEIIEGIPAAPKRPLLSVGEDLEIGFEYTIPKIETCEITAPRSTFDRFYSRSNLNFGSCRFLIPNVTKADGGLWKIIGVGEIVYEAIAFVTIRDKVL
ncbi:unnamed protein product [Leptosia nina]|uniref:Uncharacterized protein n=1 Tax=Leptosia nina TaxID=320188 RepID=A0AAV1JBX3_9NEOP